MLCGYGGRMLLRLLALRIVAENLPLALVVLRAPRRVFRFGRLHTGLRLVLCLFFG